MSNQEQKSQKEVEEEKERERLFKEKIAQLKKRDPFIYKNF